MNQQTLAKRYRPTVARKWVGLVVYFIVAVIAFVREMNARVGFWLPLDAAHAVGEAKWIGGSRDILPGIHPPIFPAIVWLFDRATTEWAAVLIAMGIAVVAFLAAIHVLVRQIASVPIAWLAVLIAGSSPAIGEIVGWGGGPNLLGFAGAIMALAATEHWIQDRDHGALIGAAIGFAIATHPLAALVSIMLVTLRMLFEVATVSSTRERTALLRSRHWIYAALSGAPLVALSGYYYFGSRSSGGVGLALPQAVALLDFLAWGTRESLIFYIINLLALVAPFALWSHRSGKAALSMTITILFIGTCFAGDPSFQSRAVYLMPAAVGLLVAAVASPIASSVRARGHAGEMTVLVAGASIVGLALVQVGSTTRLTVASDYYSRVDRSDIQVLSSLRGVDGAIASSPYDTMSSGEPTDWFVSAAAERPSVSVIGPWLSTIPEEADAGRALQQYFAGQAGVQNGVLQVAVAANDENVRTMQIGTSIDGWYEPRVLLDFSRSSWPFDVTSAAIRQPADDRIILQLSTNNSPQMLSIEARLHGPSVTLQFVGSSGVDGPIRLVLAPALRSPWAVIPATEKVVALEQGSGSSLARSRLAVAGAQSSLTAYGYGQPIDIGSPTIRDLTVTWTAVDPASEAVPATSFNERDIEEEFDFQTIVVWRKSELAWRFATTCFARIRESEALIVYRRNAECVA